MQSALTFKLAGLERLGGAQRHSLHRYVIIKDYVTIRYEIKKYSISYASSFIAK